MLIRVRNYVKKNDEKKTITHLVILSKTFVKWGEIEIRRIPKFFDILMERFFELAIPPPSVLFREVEHEKCSYMCCDGGPQ